MYPHTYYISSKNHRNQQTFSFDFVTKTKNIKNRKISVFDPCTFSLFRSEKVNFGKSHFSANWKTWKFSDLKRSIVKSPRNLREISSRFHRDFELVASQKKKKKGKLFYLSKAIFWKTSLNFDRVYLRSSSRSELQILHVYVTYPHRHFHKIFFRSEKIFFCFCPKVTIHFDRVSRPSTPLLSFDILPVYVIYLHRPSPQIIFRSEKKSFSFYFKNESHFHQSLLVYFPLLWKILLPIYVTHYLL